MSNISNRGKSNIDMSDKELDKAIEEQQIKFRKWSEKFFKAKTAYEISQLLSENPTKSLIFGKRHPEGKKGFNKLNKFKKDKIVQLAIVKYWADKKLCEEIFFKSKDKILRLAFLENEQPSSYWHDLLYGPNKIILKFLKKASDDELYAYFTNKNFFLWRIGYILNRNNIHDPKYLSFNYINPYNKISEKMYRNIILILENNPNTKIEPKIIDNGNTLGDGLAWVSELEVYKKFKKELVKIKKLKNLE